jgi:hypothetical protein
LSGHISELLDGEIGKLKIRLVSSDEADDILPLKLALDRLDIGLNIAVE